MLAKNNFRTSSLGRDLLVLMKKDCSRIMISFTIFDYFDIHKMVRDKYAACAYIMRYSYFFLQQTDMLSKKLSQKLSNNVSRRDLYIILYIKMYKTSYLNTVSMFLLSFTLPACQP